MTPRQPSDPNRKNIIFGWVIGTVVLLLLVLAIVSSDSQDSRQATTEQAALSSTPRATSTPWPTSVFPPTLRATATQIPFLREQGLGVSRSEASEAFVALGFDLESSPLNDGRERLLGLSEDGSALVEFIGPYHDLTKATLFVELSAVDNTIQGLYAVMFFASVMPTWERSADWFAATLDGMVPGQEVKSVAEGCTIRVEHLGVVNGLMISIEPAGV